MAFYRDKVYDDLAARYGQFPLVVSLEVVEHCYVPRRFARTLYDLVENDGVAIISTPSHGHVKNLALAVVGKWDSHLSLLWDGGHIKANAPSVTVRGGFQKGPYHPRGSYPSFGKVNDSRCNQVSRNRLMANYDYSRS